MKHLSEREKKIITFSIKRYNLLLSIAVSDRGEGIDTSIQERIFEPYFTTKKTSEGTGIGLYLSRLMIEKTFYGTLILSRSNQQGTTFTITLPI